MNSGQLGMAWGFQGMENTESSSSHLWTEDYIREKGYG